MVKISRNDLIEEAKQIKSFIEKNHKIPLTNKYSDGSLISIYSTAYILSCLVKDNFKSSNYQTIDVILYDTATVKDTINEKVMKEDYLKMISNFVAYCQKKHRVPSYITTQKTSTKVSFELYVYCISKIVVYYAENKTLPNYCHFNRADVSTVNINSKPSQNNSSQSTSTCNNQYNSKTGCDAMGQNNSYYCGVSALQKCLYKLGIRDVTQKQLAKVCGTTTAGTSHQGIKTGVAWASKKFNVKLTLQEAYFSDYSMKQLQDIVCNRNKALILHDLYRLKYGHYEFVKSVNVSKKEFEIVNSLGNKCDYGCYCGYVEKRSYATQKQYCNGISQKSLIIITKN